MKIKHAACGTVQRSQQEIKEKHAERIQRAQDVTLKCVEHERIQRAQEDVKHAECEHIQRTQDVKVKHAEREHIQR